MRIRIVIISQLIVVVLSLCVLPHSVAAQASPSPTPDKETQKRAEKERREEEKRLREQAKQREREERARTEYKRYQPIRTTSSYDRFKDLTTVVMDKMLVLGRDKLNFPSARHGIAEIGLIGGFSFQGTQWQRPSEVILQFEALQAYWHFLDYKQRTLILLVDGERLNLGTPGYEQFNVQYIGNLEKLFVRLSYEDFARIAGAKRVEVQLGDIEFSLEDRHLEGLRNLIAQPQ
jgi:hypothetical protein